MNRLLSRSITKWIVSHQQRLVMRPSHDRVITGSAYKKATFVSHQGQITRMSSTNPQDPNYQSQEQKVTPWDVEGEVVDGVSKAIDYEKLMKQFGCQPLTNEMIERLERLTGKKAHVLIRRGMFYCHR